MADRLRGGALRRIPGPVGWVALSVVGGALVVWLILFAPRLLVPGPSDRSFADVDDAAKRHELADSRLRLQNDVRTTLLQGLGGLAVLAGASFTYRQVRINRHQLHVAQEAQVTERYTRAIDQLGHDNEDVRLGGIYALGRIAEDSPDDASTVTEVLSAFVRGHAPWPPTRPGQYVEAAPLDRVPDLRVWGADVQAAMSVLTRCRPRDSTPRRLALGGTDLRGADLRGGDLRGAALSFANLSSAKLSDANLDGADLSFARLEQAKVAGAALVKANLFGADLQWADLSAAHLTGADLLQANLQNATLTGANLQGAHLRGAQLQRADLTGADLRGANLHGAQMHMANLAGAQLADAKRDHNTNGPAGFDWESSGARLR
jgi:uncharacterized protein YjbI with pentapeptide repeats